MRIIAVDDEKIALESLANAIKAIVAAILCLVLGWNVIWLLDLIFIILNGKIFRFLNV